ncbi:MAG: hypothetical protein DDT31_00919 [Syntrophomonadaceae bacterium]|nr:hypothetical protein [Bacillota bacterium]
MREYIPDAWKIVEIDSPEHGKIFKVLAGWHGGYTVGDSWKLSSGIKDVKIDDKVFTMPQVGGSVYICHADNECMNEIMGDVFANFEVQLQKSKAGVIRLLAWKDYLELR